MAVRILAFSQAHNSKHKRFEKRVNNLTVSLDTVRKNHNEIRSKLDQINSDLKKLNNMLKTRSSKFYETARKVDYKSEVTFTKSDFDEYIYHFNN